jgi:serine/threonine protein kinase/tetratricopeptide (TPR) repeat protein
VAKKRDDDAGTDSVTDSNVPQDRNAVTPFTTGDEMLRAMLAVSEPVVPPWQSVLRSGQVVAGVYEVVKRLGAGGMGIVYLARDLRLARHVALKMIRTGPSSTSVARLVREAQAIAQLTHPNVVTVYQIGSHDDQPFVAMEYVDGGTARTWVAAKSRTWREIVALYLAAGRGLEAAHRAQLVHRDFKPDNVLVGDDGRVRVADFGLVHGASWPTTDSGDEATASPATTSKTRTGTVMGTPAYMAPEQRGGGAVTASADQFAFAASLWEALTGALPFPSTEDDPAPTVIAAPKRPIPRHLEVALRRALSIEPATRWPSMAPLLAELARDPNAPRRRVAYAAGGLLATAAIVVPLALRGAAPPEPCNDSDAAIAPSWNAERRAAVVTALGPRAGALVGDGLDRYASEWAAAHRQACRDTRVTGSQSDDMLDRRMQCLFAARAAIDATVGALSTASPEGKSRALDAIARLPGLDRCGDIEALALEQPLPTDPDVRRRLDEAARQLADVHVADFAPKRIDRQERADAALARAREVGWTPLVARALLVHSQQLSFADRRPDAIVELREAVSIAITGNLTDIGAVAFADLATLLAERDQIDAAEVALLAARAYDDRAGPGPMQRVLLAGSTVASRAHKDDEAVALARELVASVDKNPGRSLNPMTSRHQLAMVLGAAARFDDTLQVLDEAIAWGVANYGADHAEVGSYRAIRASYLMNLGRFDDAITEAKSGLAILGTWYGPESVQLADVLLTLGDAHSRAGQLEPVMPYLDRALICARNGDDPEMIAAIETQRTIYYLRVGDLEHAAPAADALVAAAEQTGQFVPLLNALLVRGNVSKDRKRYADAERDLSRAIELGKPLGEHPAIQNLRVELGRAWIALGRADEVRAMLTPQVQALATNRDIDPMLVVETHVVLAAALHVLGDKPGARATVTEADRLASAHPDRPEFRALVDDWHAKHR